jgi:uncharacterized membrane protein YraQ (UPF0718 family)
MPRRARQADSARADAGNDDRGAPDSGAGSNGDVETARRRRIGRALNASTRAMLDALPIVAGMLLLTSLLVALVPGEVISRLFGHGGGLDVWIAVALGSVAAGSPIAGYVLGGELLARGASLAAVTALLVSWVTVGIVQLPAESLLFGWRFAVMRNVVSFLLAIAVAYLAAGLLQMVAGAP